MRLLFYTLWKACFTLLAQGSILDGKLALHIRIGEERHGEPVGGDPQGARHQARGSRVGAGRVAPDHQLAGEGRYNPSILLAFKIARRFGLQIEDVFIYQEEDHE